MLNSFVDLRCVHSTLAPNFAHEYMYHNFKIII